MSLGISAHADDYGCTVLLCLANPAGPMAVAECVSPIKKLYRDLMKGKAFPKCELANAPDSSGGKSWAETGRSYYDPCPPGTTALEAGTVAMRSATSTTYYVGIGEGNELRESEQSGLPNKTCVGNRTGEVALDVGTGDSVTTLSASVFDQVIVIAPNAQTNYIDVYVDSAFLHRVRW